MKKIIDNCIFCRILQGEIPSYKVYEDEFWIGIVDNNPANRGHVIVISKNHFENIFELPGMETERLLPVVKAIAIAVKDTFDCDGINLLQNNGESAGQTVNHFHMHIIPRFYDDNITIKWEKSESNDFDQVRKMIMQNLGDLL